MNQLNLEIKPPREVCAALATAVGTAHEIRMKIREIRKSQGILMSMMQLLKYGVIDALQLLKQVAAALTNEATAIVSTIAAQVTAALLDASSAIIRAVMQQIMSILLTCILAGPKALLSLISLPHEAAKKNVAGEYRHLLEARKQYKKLEKYLDMLEGDGDLAEVLDRLRDAVRFLDQAINSFTLATTEFDGEFFNVQAYKNGMASMLSAIRITENSSRTLDVIGFQNRVEDRTKEIMAEFMVWLNLETKTRQENTMKRRNTWISDPSADIKKSGNKFNRAEIEVKNQYNDDKFIKRQNEADAIYQHEMEYIQTWRLGEISHAEAEAKFKAFGDVIDQMCNPSLYGKFGPKGKRISGSSITPLGTQMISQLNGPFKFVVIAYAMQEIADAYGNVFAELGYAYPYYMKSQFYCVTCYDFTFVIRTAMAALQQLIADASRAMEKVADKAVDLSLEACKHVRDDFSTELARDHSGAFAESRARLVMTKGHTILLASYKSTSAMLSDAMIAATEMDKMVGADYEAFVQFRRDLAGIKDWDNATGVWSVDYLGSAVAPYLTATSAQFGIISTDPKKVAKSVRKLGAAISALLNHNRKVSSVLESYVPPFSDYAISVRAILAGIGLLEAFLESRFNMQNFAARLQSFDEIGEPKAEIMGCQKAYPDLFQTAAFQDHLRVKKAEAAAKRVSPTAMGIRKDTLEGYHDAVAYQRSEDYASAYKVPKSGLNSNETRNEQADSGMVG